MKTTLTLLLTITLALAAFAPAADENMINHVMYTAADVTATQRAILVDVSASSGTRGLLYRPQVCANAISGTWTVKIGVIEANTATNGTAEWVIWDQLTQGANQCRSYGSDDSNTTIIGKVSSDETTRSYSNQATAADTSWDNDDAQTCIFGDAATANPGPGDIVVEYVLDSAVGRLTATTTASIKVE